MNHTTESALRSELSKTLGEIDKSMAVVRHAAEANGLRPELMVDERGSSRWAPLVVARASILTTFVQLELRIEERAEARKRRKG